MSHARYLVGDVFDRMAELPDDSIDLVLTSPPFLALRSYLPADHPDKAKEIGSEPTPAAFLDTLLHLTAEWRRVLAPHGSICVELGDTYAGSGGAGGDYAEGGLRDGQPAFSGSSARSQVRSAHEGHSPSQPSPASGYESPQVRQVGTSEAYGGGENRVGTDRWEGGFTGRRSHGSGGGSGWPLPKSLCGIPHLYHLSLAYGRNVLRAPLSSAQMLDCFEAIVADMELAVAHDAPGPALSPRDLLVMMRDYEARAAAVGPVVEIEPWRVRNVVAWCRPNPPVGALGDKVRPATSYMTIATVARDRYFDLDAIRELASPNTNPRTAKGVAQRSNDCKTAPDGNRDSLAIQHRHATAPPLDHWWFDDEFDQDAWLISTQPYKGSHYATWPMALCERPIKAMVPQRVCTTCGEPSRRIVETRPTGQNLRKPGHPDDITKQIGAVSSTHVPDVADRTTTGWSDCGHDTWRTGILLDPFAGSGTTLAAATGHGRDAIGIDLDERNADLARERVGMFLDVEIPTTEGAA